MVHARAEAILERLRAAGNPADLAGMERYGIDVSNSFAVRAPVVWAIAREIGRDRALAAELWVTGNREARLIAAAIDDPAQVTDAQLEAWVADFRSWDICDGVCGHLFDRTPFAWEKAVEWAGRDEEFVKRAGFVLMAQRAVHDRRAEDARFEAFLPIIAREAGDNRTYVKKAVNWALRQIGKRNAPLNKSAIETALAIQATGTPSGRWIAADALRELRSAPVQRRVDAGRSAGAQQG